MATHNGARFVRSQLESILSQLAAGDEIIVVDDASVDGTAALVAQAGDPRVRVLRNTRNLGVRASFERALRATRHSFVFLSDQDDVWLPGKRDALVAALSRGALLALSDASVIDGGGDVVASSFMARRGGFRGSVFATVIKNRYLGCTMAFRRELLELALPIPAEVPMHDMWLGALAAQRGRVSYVGRPLIQYRRHDGNLSPERRAGLAQMLRWRWRLVRLLFERRARGPVPVSVAE
jgi:glycosyltransferase involved in cell wall biosynthesis